jgi:hypothetical protein
MITPRNDVPMPARIAVLPRDHRGFAVPWFVEWRDGLPIFPILDPRKWSRAVTHRLCWICGQPLGRVAVFPIGPMCAINRITSEPGSHYDCATYAVMVCPFLVNPSMRRVPLERLERLGEVIAPPGLHSLANPGAIALWATRQSSVLMTATGPLIELGEPDAVTWWASGAPATPEVAAAAFTKGAGRLLATASAESEDAVVAFALQLREARRWLPDPDLVREVTA